MKTISIHVLLLFLSGGLFPSFAGLAGAVDGPLCGGVTPVSDLNDASVGVRDRDARVPDPKQQIGGEAAPREQSAAAPAGQAAARKTAEQDIQNLIAKLPPESRHHLNLQYVPGGRLGAIPDSVQNLDLFVPPGEGPFPLVFWIHGGGWHGGSKENSGINLALKFLPEGFALASINYRLTVDAPFPAQIEDCNAALAYLRKHARKYHLDPQQVGALGHSAGAHLAALMAVTGGGNRFSSGPPESVRVQAAVCWATPADLDRERGQWPKDSMMYNGPQAPLWQFFPQKKYDDDFARKASPASYVHPRIAPMIIVHGAKDALVPPGQAVAFANALKHAGVDVTLRLDPDRGHDVMNAPAVGEAIAFFKRALKPTP